MIRKRILTGFLCATLLLQAATVFAAETSGEIMSEPGENGQPGENGGPGGMGGPAGNGRPDVNGGPGGNSGPGEMDRPDGNGGPGGMGRPDGNGGPGGMDGGSFQADNDPEVQEVLAAAGSTFTQNTFTDPETGASLEYSLYIPSDYDEAEEYPLLMFIPDSSGSGKSAAQLVEQYYGAAVWATDEEQKKHPSFVLVPAFSETVVDDNWNTSDQIETAVKLIEMLEETYRIDRNRLYTTGQSMGCMTSLYLNSKYPDLFAASLYVSGQWDISVLDGMREQTFFYITSAGDAKASGGQSEVMDLFDAKGTAYTYGEWNCKDPEQNEKAEQLIDEGLSANMIRFEADFTDDTGNQQSLTHMLSFNYAYKIEAVRDWLFEQTR